MSDQIPTPVTLAAVIFLDGPNTWTENFGGDNKIP